MANKMTNEQLTKQNKELKEHLQIGATKILELQNQLKSESDWYTKRIVSLQKEVERFKHRELALKDLQRSLVLEPARFVATDQYGEQSAHKQAAN